MTNATPTTERARLQAQAEALQAEMQALLTSPAAEQEDPFTLARRLDEVKSQWLTVSQKLSQLPS
ncbi:hypothetical protein E3E12_06600 [Formicincola oecophyllae]|uniref:Uncharacterized protein n=1 Tax=Formicincola oecophyllae TaxID=2558361 RepID=A0A4Y6UBR7_9PROT|nr:hypothetical protein [Formicincola oecophyllae]QDH13907.1 hypothetical protein E3E12_06600 [Formicincola oecophyllae]